MIADPRSMGFLIQNWNSRYWFKLLGFAFTKEELSKMSFPQKVSRVYRYNSKDTFKDLSEQEGLNGEVKKRFQKAQEKPESLSLSPI